MSSKACRCCSQSLGAGAGISSQPRRLCQIDTEAATPALVAAGHFGAGMAELFLHISFIDFGTAGQPRAQGMPGTEFCARGIGQVRAQPCGRHANLDQPCDMAVFQACFLRALAIARHVREDRPEADAPGMPLLFQRMNRAGLIA